MLYFDLGVDGVEVSGPAKQVAAIATDQTPQMHRPANSFSRVYISHNWEHDILDHGSSGSEKVRRLDLSYDPDGEVKGQLVSESCFSVNFNRKPDGGATIPSGGGRPQALIAVPTPMPVILP